MEGIAKITMSSVMAAGLGIGAAVLAGALAAAQTPALDSDSVPRAMASNGVMVPMPDIAALDCAGKAEALRRLDLSNYRGQEPLPPGHQDWPIFDYEDRLARSYYTDCMLREQALGDPGAAFSFGFQTQ